MRMIFYVLQELQGVGSQSRQVYAHPVGNHIPGVPVGQGQICLLEDKVRS